MVLPIVQVGAYMIPSGAFTRCSHLDLRRAWDQTARSGSSSYIDVKPAQDIQLVVIDCESTRQDCACRITRPVVSRGERGHGIGGRIVEEHAGRGCGLPGSGAPTQ